MPAPFGQLSTTMSNPSSAEADLDRFFALSLDLLCVAGLDGYFKRVNPAWTRVLGWSAEELLSRPVADFMHPEDRERTLAARARLARGEPIGDLENRYLCKDGSHRWLAWQSSVDLEAGTVFAVARDITERRQSDHEHLVLCKLESTGLLAGGIAHDFNNLLTGLVLNLEMIRLVGPVAEQQGQHLRQAQETVRAAQGLTQQLITFAQGGGSVRRVIDPAPLLRQSFELTLSGSNVRGECELPHDLWPVEVDEAQIAQVVRNLTLNAREAMPAGGVAWLRAENVTLGAAAARDLPPGDYVRFTLTDEGVGIPAELLGKVFDPYFSTKERGSQKGMGLGLTICHSVLQRHGGSITLVSLSGRGTIVRCLLPAARGKGERGVVPSGKDPGLAAPRSILVMDDEPWLRDVVGQALGQIGYRVELAKDGEEAIELFISARAQGRPFGMVLLDLTVRGGMGGREVIRVLREIDPQVRAVLMTGYNHEETFRDYVRHGFQAALPKPFSIDSLRIVLEDVAGGPTPRTPDLP
jgi:PAS domain S-box-containing protein